jgi:hypothetical protein
MASLRISILDSFLSGGSVGSNCRSVQKAELNASTLSLSLVACARRYFVLARLRRRFSSRVSLRGGADREDPVRADDGTVA